MKNKDYKALFIIENFEKVDDVDLLSKGSKGHPRETLEKLWPQNNSKSYEPWEPR